jgi:hypothetical protein
MMTDSTLQTMERTRSVSLAILHVMPQLNLEHKQTISNAARYRACKDLLEFVRRLLRS